MSEQQQQQQQQGDSTQLFASSDLKNWGFLEWLIVGGSLFLVLAALIVTIVLLARSNSKLKKQTEMQTGQPLGSMASRMQAPRGEYGSVAQALKHGKQGQYGVPPESVYRVMPAFAQYGSLPAGIQNKRAAGTEYGSVSGAVPQYGSLPIQPSADSSANEYGSIPQRLSRETSHESVPMDVSE